MEGIDNKYLEDAILTLAKTLGVKDHVDDQALASLLVSHNVEVCIREIAQYLGLPIRIDLSYVPRGYRPGQTDGFRSKDLAKPAWGGQGAQAITAQVSIPEFLPLYGTSGLNNYPIKVKVGEDCTDSPATFIAVMAHELSHVVLHSFHHREKDNEVYTDLTAMILGFSAVMMDGRKVVKTTYGAGTTQTQTTTYGYLSDEQFAYADDRIETILRDCWKRRNDLSQRTAALETTLGEAERTLVLFENYLGYVDRKLDKKMSQQDASRICACHQLEHAGEIERSTQRARNQVRRMNAFMEHLDHYKDDVLATITRYENEVYVVTSDLNSAHGTLLADVGILRRHVSPLYRLRVEGRSGLR